MAYFTCMHQNVNLCLLAKDSYYGIYSFLSLHHNAQMHRSMTKFSTCFLIFQGRLSVDIAAHCAPSLCSFTHAWFHKRCTISNFDFGCSCPFGYLEKLRLHILCLFALIVLAFATFSCFFMLLMYG
jgi:hypothetical protein